MHLREHMFLVGLKVFFCMPTDEDERRSWLNEWIMNDVVIVESCAELRKIHRGAVWTNKPTYG